MLAQVQDQAVAMDLRIQRQVRAEAVLPVQGEAEEIEVELLGLFDRENAQDGDGRGERHGGSLAVGGTQVDCQSTDCRGELSCSRGLLWQIRALKQGL
ncbi:hypothetical protein D3C79_864910 [compost metagenome]